MENGGNLIIKGTVNPCSLLLFPGGKEPACQCRRHKRHLCDPGLGRFPGGGHGNPLQYSYLENPLDRGVWQATVHRVAKSQTRLKQLSKANKIVMFWSQSFKPLLVWWWSLRITWEFPHPLFWHRYKCHHVCFYPFLLQIATSHAYWSWVLGRPVTTITYKNTVVCADDVLQKLPGSIQSWPCSDSEPCIHGHLGLHGAQPGPEPLVLVKTCHPPPYHPLKGTAQPQKLINILFIAFQSPEFQPFPRLGREICHTKMCFIDMKINLDWLLFFN